MMKFLAFTGPENEAALHVPRVDRGNDNTLVSATKTER
jgi:hypothetical protein